MIKTFTPKASQVEHGWHVLDATDQILGRLATQVASYLRGKHKPTYSPHMDMGDHVVVVNAGKIRVTGQKLKQKVYYRHSGYPGGLKQRTLEQQLAKFPGRVIESAVKGMLPKTSLGQAMYRKLHVYVGPGHPHHGQIVESERAKTVAGPAVLADKPAEAATVLSEPVEAQSTRRQTRTNPAQVGRAPATRTARSSKAGATDASAEAAPDAEKEPQQ